MKKSLSNTWSSWFEGEKVSEDFMEEREQDFPSLEKFEKLEGELSLFDQKVVLDQKLLKLDQ